jgi:hypothetical protein
MTAPVPLEEYAAKINAAHRAAYGNAGKAIEKAAECGRLLIQAKTAVGHGGWLPWLEAKTEVSPRQCQRYMQLADRWDEIKYDAETHLTLTDALKSLAKPKAEAAHERQTDHINAPKELRKEAIKEKAKVKRQAARAAQLSRMAPTTLTGWRYGYVDAVKRFSTNIWPELEQLTDEFHAMAGAKATEAEVKKQSVN